MCCKIDLNSEAEARHFLGKSEPKILPKTCDNVAGDIVYTGKPAMSFFDKLMARYKSQQKTTA